MTYDYNLHITLSKSEARLLNDILKNAVPQTYDEEWLIGIMLEMVRGYIVERK